MERERQLFFTFCSLSEKDHLETMASTFLNKGVISNLGLICLRVSQKFNSFTWSQGPFEVWCKTKGQKKGVKTNFCDWLLLGGKIFLMLKHWLFESYFKSTQTTNYFQVTCKNLLSSVFIQVASGLKYTGRLVSARLSFLWTFLKTHLQK